MVSDGDLQPKSEWSVGVGLDRILAPRRQELDYDGWAGVTLITNRPFAHTHNKRRLGVVSFISSQRSFAYLPESTIANRDYITRSEELLHAHL